MRQVSFTLLLKMIIKRSTLELRDFAFPKTLPPLPPPFFPHTFVPGAVALLFENPGAVA